MLRKRMKALALVVALGLWPAGAAGAPGVDPAPVRATSGGGWVDRSGFGELVYRSMLEGYLVGSFTGFALVDASDPSSTLRIGLGGVIGTAVGLAVPLLLSRGEARSGDVVLMGAGHGIGMLNGFFVPLTIQLLPCSGVLGSPACPFPLDQSRLDAALSAGLSLAAGGLAAYFGPRLNLSPGQAEAVGSAALWGGVAGFFLGTTFVAYGDRPGVALGTMVGLADAGFLAALYFRDFFDMDRARIWFMDLGVGLGAGAGLALALFISPSFVNHTGLSLAILGGAAAGWAVSYFATSGLDGFKSSAPPEKATAHFGSPSIRPLASLARGERAVGVQIDVLQGRF